MRLIDADALWADVKKHAESYFAEDFAREWVDRQPTVDAVPVVRCQDCKHSILDEDGYRFCDYTLGGADVDDRFYCADGERRADDAAD